VHHSRSQDIDSALTQPKKVAYLEETIRAMEQGQLKIRVRSIENEQALSRLALSTELTHKMLLASVLLNLGLAGVGVVPRMVWFVGAAGMGAQALVTHSISEPGHYAGGAGGVMPVGQWRRNAVRFRQLDRLAARLVRLEKANDSTN